MGDNTYFAWSAQAQCQHPTSIAGHDLHQHQADQRLHSPVLEPPHQYQHAPSTFPSSTSFQPVEIHPQQHHIYHNQTSHYQTAAGYNGSFTSPPLYNAHPVVQQTPPPSMTANFPLDREQYIEHQFQQMHQLLQLQYQSNMEAINQQFQLFWSYWTTSRRMCNQQQSSPIITQQQATSYPNAIDSTAISEQQPSMDQLIVPASTTANCDDCDKQQQQKEAPKIVLAVPTPDGSSEIELEYALQSLQAAEVFNSFNVGSLRAAEIIFDQCPPINTKCTIRECGALAVKFHQLNSKFVQHFLDRNGHRMDSPCGRASVFSDVFKWIVNHGGLKIKLRFFVHQS